MVNDYGERHVHGRYTLPFKIGESLLLGEQRALGTAHFQQSAALAG